MRRPTPEGAERLAALERTNDGFELAEVDLDLRGEGTILGTRQKGVNDLKLASLRRHRKYVALAREVAFGIVGADPALAAPPRPRASSCGLWSTTKTVSTCSRAEASGHGRPNAGQVGQRARMRVIAGEKGGRRLLAPPGRGTRPTSDRVREAAFSMLDSLGVRRGGPGMGPLRRERRHGDRGALAWGGPRHLRGAGAWGGLGHPGQPGRAGLWPARATVVCADVLNWVASQVAGPDGRRTSGDPQQVHGGAVNRRRAGGGDENRPGLKSTWSRPTRLTPGRAGASLLGALAPLGPLVLAETGDELVLPDGWRALRSKRYGGTVVTLARPIETENDKESSK